MATRVPLPPFLAPFSRSRLRSARTELALVVGLACALSALAGCYPRIEDGIAYRVVMALQCGFAGAGVMHAASAARSRLGAFGRAFGLSIALGVAVTVFPAMMMANEHTLSLVIIFGPLFGGPTGCAYGLVLGMLAAIVQPHLGDAHDAVDRRTRALSLWTLPIALLPALAFATDNEATMHGYPPPKAQAATCVACVLATGLFAVSLVRAAHAHLRLRARRRWLARVAAGAVPAFRLRVHEWQSILEWLPAAEQARGPYREAQWIAVATVREAPSAVADVSGGERP